MVPSLARRACSAAPESLKYLISLAIWQERRVVRKLSESSQENNPGETVPIPHYDVHYSHHAHPVYAAVRRDAYGEDIGQQSWLTADELRRFIEWLGLSPISHVLDIASGAGGPALFVAKTVGCQVTGQDINEHGVATANRIARELGLGEHARFQVGDANESLPFDDAIFDALLCIDAINHLSKRPPVLAQWHRVLKRGGHALFTDPITVTGMLASDEIAIRSSIGYMQFTPEGVNERLLEAARFALVRRVDTTENVAQLARRRQDARMRYREELVRIEGLELFEGEQRQLQVAWRLASERRLSRYVFLARKP